MHVHAEKCRACTPCEAGGRLTKRNPEATLRIRITDVPPRDVRGGECHPKYYQVEIRVPGSEQFYCVPEAYGGVIHARQQDLASVVKIGDWVRDMAAELTRVEGELPPADGYYLIRAHVVDENGFASEPSEATEIKLSLTSPQPPKIAVEALPVSIVA